MNFLPKYFSEISSGRLVKYLFYRCIMVFYKILFISPLQIIFLKLFGAEIGKNTIIEENCKFINLYVNGFKNLKIGNNVYIGPNCIFDLANEIIIEDNVTLSANIFLNTHLNVGYSDHPLMKIYPRRDGKVITKSGSFIGINSTILNNSVIAENNMIAAYSLINFKTEKNSMYAGIPAKKIKTIEL